jgi:hypothetical protein
VLGFYAYIETLINNFKAAKSSTNCKITTTFNKDKESFLAGASPSQEKVLKITMQLEFYVAVPISA